LISDLEKPSLIPYLKPVDGRLYLKLSKDPNGRTSQKMPGFPFFIVSDTDPLSLIVEAKVLSDARTNIKSVFLLTQKDEYHVVKDEIYPITNHDIDRAWQTLFAFLKDRNENDKVFFFKDQLGDNGMLLPWSPLFFCQHRKEFFHPPCPECGFPLEMAGDDALLSDLGLQPYSSSLKRYLFCERCYDTGNESNFYVRELASSDPAILRDQQDLIGGFGQLDKDANRNDPIPCLKCDGFQQCYETDQLAKTRIVPISFYPFYMIALPAPSVHFLDLLPLLAGADADEPASRLGSEGQQGRLKYLTSFGKVASRKTHFFSNKDEKFFLEVLYLKLSLLGELARIIFPSLNTFKHPDLGLSIDRIWADVAEQSDLLPRYWNFQLQLLGIGPDTCPSPSLSKVPPSYGLYFLGSVWFYVLLVNAKQSVSEVYKEAAKTIDKIGTNDTAEFGNFFENLESAVFSPQNIFWHPDQNSVHTSWTTPWKGALNLGFFLLRHGMSPISKWSENLFWQEFEDLRETIKNSLFQPGAQIASPPPADDNEVIHNILKKISSKWRSGISKDLPTREPVTLSSKKSGEEKYPEDELAETVIVKAQDVARAETLDSASQVEEDLPKTVILAPDLPETQRASSKEPRESDIPETVIISPHKPAPAQPDTDQKRSAQNDRPEPAKNSLSKESKNQTAEKQSIDVKGADDDLPMTVVIDTKKLKKKHKDHG
jgi:hypothetical protein